MKTMTFTMLLMFLLLAACTTALPVIQPTKIEIPIAVKCEPTIKITPITEYPFDRATKEMSLYDKLELSLEELHSVKGQNLELTAALRECTK